MRSHSVEHRRRRSSGASQPGKKAICASSGRCASRRAGADLRGRVCRARVEARREIVQRRMAAAVALGFGAAAEERDAGLDLVQAEVGAGAAAGAAVERLRLLDGARHLGALQEPHRRHLVARRERLARLGVRHGTGVAAQLRDSRCSSDSEVSIGCLAQACGIRWRPVGPREESGGRGRALLQRARRAAAAAAAARRAADVDDAGAAGVPADDAHRVADAATATTAARRAPRARRRARRAAS